MESTNVTVNDREELADDSDINLLPLVSETSVAHQEKDNLKTSVVEPPANSISGKATTPADVLPDPRLESDSNDDNFRETTEDFVPPPPKLQQFMKMKKNHPTSNVIGEEQWALAFLEKMAGFTKN